MKYLYYCMWRLATLCFIALGVLVGMSMLLWCVKGQNPLAGELWFSILAVSLCSIAMADFFETLYEGATNNAPK